MARPKGTVYSSEQKTASFMKRIFYNANGCWDWTGARFINGGYGAVNWGGKHIKTHRVSYEMFNGPIPDGLHVCHKCDRPVCVNPKHLFLGTPKDNMRDCIKKGRAKKEKGVDRYNAKLDEDKVRRIRFLFHDAKMTCFKISKMFRVNSKTITQIVLRNRWKHVL